MGPLLKGNTLSPTVQIFDDKVANDELSQPDRSRQKAVHLEVSAL